MQLLPCSFMLILHWRCVTTCACSCIQCIPLLSSSTLTCLTSPLPRPSTQSCVQAEERRSAKLARQADLKEERLEMERQQAKAKRLKQQH